MILFRGVVKIIIVFCNIYFCYSKRYDNYTLFRAIPVTTEHLNFFRNLTNFYRINFWRPPSMVIKPIEFVIAPENRDQFLFDVENLGIFLTTIMENVQSAFDNQIVKTYIRRNMNSFDWMHYYRINDIYSWLHDMETAHPDVMQLKIIGKTYEYRNIMSVHVNFKDGPKNRATVIIEGGIHAREWIAPAFVTFFLNQIVTSSESNDVELKKIAIKYKWIFVPLANPDGYEYSHTTDRLWRKNRRGYGVDINRNFGYKFGTVGISFSQISEIYSGQTAFSEYESTAIRDLVINNSRNLHYYFSFHSYGQYIIIPYAHTQEKRDNFFEMRDIATTASIEIKKLYGTQYSIGTAYDTVGYLVSGASTCWVKDSYKVPYVATFELRDQGNFGFALPSKQILPTCRETMLGMLSFLSPNRQTYNHSYPYNKHKGPHRDRDQKVNSQIGMANARKNKILYSFVIFCNIILFIIARFD